MPPARTVNEPFGRISSGEPNRIMKRTPRRHRARLKAWLYLAVFGPGKDDTEDTDASMSVTPESERDEDRDDQNSTEP
jgi:hypothetical protein